MRSPPRRWRAKFEDIRHLVAGSRGKLALQNGEIDQGMI
jgi:hypothetical protein